ncbi:unnamed protein product [Paramecium sonneborni]|uniref:Uncharacterized protein n=1 Tax=Paramecium sonneborni TaxID=65129 RepID=A0A8S1LNE5_9CILI|nr:unnamed protein product [Paramecium sonneborni]
MLQQYRGNSQPSRSNQIQIYSRQNNQLMNQFTMFQEFDSMSNRMMQQMDNQMANLGFGSIFRGFDDLENEMMEFSNLHKHMKNLNQMDVNAHAKNGVFQVYSSSYVQSTKLGPDGKVIQEKYFDNNAVARGVNGHTISERQQGYKNSDGIDKFAHERLMNEKGKKHIRERDKTGQITTTNHYQNIEEDQVEQFENEWMGIGKTLCINQSSNGGFKALKEQSNLKDFNNRQLCKNQLTYGTPSKQKKNEIQSVPLGKHSSSFNNNPTKLALQQSNQQSTVHTRPPQPHQPMRVLPSGKQEFTGVYQNKNIKNLYPQAG